MSRLHVVAQKPTYPRTSQPKVAGNRRQSLASRPNREGCLDLRRCRADRRALLPTAISLHRIACAIGCLISKDLSAAARDAQDISYV
jgi:hypothetical protein